VKIESVTCTDNCSFVIINGKLFVFGKNEFGVLGLGDSNIAYTDEPRMIPF